MYWVTVHSVGSYLLVSKDLAFSFRMNCILSTWGPQWLDLMYFHGGLSFFSSFCGSFKFFCGSGTRVLGRSLACSKYIFYHRVTFPLLFPMTLHIALPYMSEDMEGQSQAMQPFLTVGGWQNTDTGCQWNDLRRIGDHLERKEFSKYHLKQFFHEVDWNGDYN